MKAAAKSNAVDLGGGSWGALYCHKLNQSTSPHRNYHWSGILKARSSRADIYFIPGHFSGKVLVRCIRCEIWFSAFGGLVSWSINMAFAALGAEPGTGI